MRRRRCILTFVAFLSLLLSMATAALWMRSLTVADYLIYSHPIRINDRYARTDWSVLSGCGALSITRARLLPPDDASADWLKKLESKTGGGWWCGVVDDYPPSWEAFVAGLHAIGYSSGTDSHKVIRHSNSVELPDWVLLLAVSIPSQVAFIRMIRARRARNRRGFQIDPGAGARRIGDGA